MIKLLYKIIYFFREKLFIYVSIKDQYLYTDQGLEVYGSVIVPKWYKIKNIPCMFYKVHGSFICSNNNLTSLKNSPILIGENFICSHNKLTNLNYSPHKVLFKFDCSYNILTTLESSLIECGTFTCNQFLKNLKGGPSIVETFNCSYNLLTTLEGSPRTCQHFLCNDNILTTLEGGPVEVYTFNCTNNKLSNLEGAPKTCNGYFISNNNRLTTLKGCPDQTYTIECNNNFLENLIYSPSCVNFHIVDNPFMYFYGINECTNVYVDQKNFTAYNKIIFDLAQKNKSNNTDIEIILSIIQSNLLLLNKVPVKKINGIRSKMPFFNQIEKDLQNKVFI